MRGKFADKNAVLFYDMFPLETRKRNIFYENGLKTSQKYSESPVRRPYLKCVRE